MARSIRNSLEVIHEVPPHIALPVANYGGTERVVQGLVRGLSDAGINVKVRCSGDSFPDPAEREKFRLTAICETAFGMEAAYWPPKKVIERSLHELFSDVAQQNRAGAPTLVHAHTEDTHLMVAHRFGTRAVVTTVHNTPKDWVREFYSDFPMVAISKAQAASPAMKGFDFVRTVYNGIDKNLYTPAFSVAADAPLVFLGRIGAKKGADLAVKIALETGNRLILAGPKDAEEPDFFDREILPALQSHPEQIIYAGEVSDHKQDGEIFSPKCSLLREAKALLFPIRWEEPFGMVMAEAMACGTPVVAIDYPGSSVDEIIRNGINGYKAKDAGDAAAAIRSGLDAIDRKAVYDDFLGRFTVECMTEGYIRVYEEIRRDYLRPASERATARACQGPFTRFDRVLR